MIKPEILSEFKKEGIKMEISITAVTQNRRFTNSLIRHADALAPLKRLGVGIDTSSLPFDVLQLVFLNKSQDYLRAVGRKGDRMFLWSGVVLRSSGMN